MLIMSLLDVIAWFSHNLEGKRSEIIVYKSAVSGEKAH